MNTQVKNKEELAKPENIAKLKKITEEIIREKTFVANPLFAEEESKKQIEEIMPVINVIVKDYIDNIIEIPRVVIEQPQATAMRIRSLLLQAAFPHAAGISLQKA